MRKNEAMRRRMVYLSLALALSVAVSDGTMFFFLDEREQGGMAMSQEPHDNGGERTALPKKGADAIYPLNMRRPLDGGEAGVPSRAKTDEQTGALRCEVSSILVRFAMMVLDKGTFDEVESLGLPIDDGTLFMLREAYSHLGIDETTRSFRVRRCAKHDLVTAYDQAGKALSQMRVSFLDRDALVIRIVDRLMERGDTACAHGHLVLFCSGKQREKWLLERVRKLFAKGEFLFILDSIDSIQRGISARRNNLTVIKAWALLSLGDADEACRVAEEAFLNCSDKGDRMFLALLLFLQGGSGHQERAYEVLEEALGYDGRPFETWCRPDAIKAYVAEKGHEGLMVLGQVLVPSSLADAVRFMEACFDVDADIDADGYGHGEVLVVLSLRFMDVMTNLSVADCTDTQEGKDCVILFHRMVELLERRCMRQSESHHDVALYDKLVATNSQIMKSSEPLVSEACAAKILQQKTVREEQRKLYEERRARKQGEDRLIRTDAYGSENGKAMTSGIDQEIPHLCVKLFGGLEVRIGGEVVSSPYFKRQKVKTLLAVLVINLGKEISRDRLSEILWPGSPYEAAKRNFYGIWSLLKKALQTPVGEECPYFIRSQFCCKLDSRFVTSDVKDFEEACQALIFKTPDSAECSRLYHEFMGSYQGELLPSETKNAVINEARHAIKVRRADALSACAGRLYERGEYQLALWFARAVLERDNTREDAYITLMQAQIAIGQRTAALKTYLTCRRYLADELGIDPSVKAVRLYNDIIMTEGDYRGA